MEGKSFFPLVPYSLLLLLLPPLPSSSSTTPDLKPCGFKAIYNFGDSLSDTGNEKFESSDPHAWKYPPGMPIGGVATGRFCDGLLIIDRIATAAGLPYVNPYENKSLDHSKGVNFAVGGTGLLSKELRLKWNVKLTSQNSLDVQLHWFDQYLLGAFKNDTVALQDHLKSSLIMIAGGSVNDYYNLQNMTGIPNLERKIMIMPDVMKSMRDALQKFIRYGATKIIVTGLIEGGCLPMYYNGVDKLHCDREANEYHNLHNQLLQQEIGLLGRMFPNVSIVYGDIWSANQWILDHYTSLGFIYPQEQCCGAKDQGCCKKPSEYVHWDYAGHFTDAAYKYMYDLMIPQLSLGLKCHSKKNDEP
ncbi:GDSL esterase/lipase At3g48460 [Linum perenne]